MTEEPKPPHPFAMTYPSKYSQESDKYDIQKEIEWIEERYRMMEEERYMLHQNISYLVILPRSYGYHLPPLEKNLDISPLEHTYSNRLPSNQYDYSPYHMTSLFFFY